MTNRSKLTINALSIFFAYFHDLQQLKNWPGSG